MLIELFEGNHNLTGTMPAKVSWIKQCRDEIGCGLKEAKSLLDRLYNTGNPVAVIDTKVEREFRFLEDLPRIDSRLVRVLSDDRTQRESPVVVNTKKILSRASIQLIRAGGIREAIRVLEVLEEV